MSEQPLSHARVNDWLSRYDGGESEGGGGGFCGGGGKTGAFATGGGCGAETEVQFGGLEESGHLIFIKKGENPSS